MVPVIKNRLKAAGCDSKLSQDGGGNSSNLGDDFKNSICRNNDLDKTKREMQTDVMEGSSKEADLRK